MNKGKCKGKPSPSEHRTKDLSKEKREHCVAAAKYAIRRIPYETPIKDDLQAAVDGEYEDVLYVIDEILDFHENLHARNDAIVG